MISFDSTNSIRHVFPIVHSAIGCCVVFMFALPLRAEIPLPSAVVYGKLDAVGEVVATVTRDGEPLLEVTAEFTEFEGAFYYVVRVPMETSGTGAPGPNGLAAREGDVLEEISLNGEPLVVLGTPLVPARIFERSVVIDGGFMRGDANGDGRLDVSDAVSILLWLFAGREALGCQDAADIDDSGGVNLTDVVRGLSYLFQQGDPPRAPYPSCGDDPTPDILTCDAFVPCEGPDGGGGAAVVAALNRNQPGPTPVAVGPDAIRELAGAAVRGLIDLRNAARIDRPDLSVSPSVVRFGDIGAGSPGVKTISIVNHSSELVKLGLRSSARGTAVAPATLEIPAEGSMVAFVMPEGDGDVSSGAISVFAESVLAAWIPVEFQEGAKPFRTRIRVEDVLAPTGSTEPIVVPVEVSSSIALDVSAFTVDFDRRRFRTPDGGDATVTLFDLEAGATLNSAIELIPTTPLTPETSTLTVRDAVAIDRSGGDAPVASVHGEICALREWLDLDGDGLALASEELVLARRHLTGELDLWPESWSDHSESAEDTLRSTIDARAHLFDVDGSGAVDQEDFRTIAVALSGFDIRDRDVDARVRNLALERNLASGGESAIDAIAITTCREGAVVRSSFVLDSATAVDVTSICLSATGSRPDEILMPSADLGLEWHVEARSDAARMLIHDPLGRPLASALGENPLFELLAPEGTFDLEVLSAFEGANARSVASVSTTDRPNPCDDDCDDAPRDDVDGLRAVLAHLFEGAPPPECLARYDVDEDGDVELDDVIALAAGGH